MAFTSKQDALTVAREAEGMIEEIRDYFDSFRN